MYIAIANLEGCDRGRVTHDPINSKFKIIKSNWILTPWKIYKTGEMYDEHPTSLPTNCREI